MVGESFKSVKALAVFGPDGDHPLKLFLKDGFAHVFVVVQSNNSWVRVDSQAGKVAIDIVCASSYSLGDFYRDEGLYVVETTQRYRPSFWPLETANCVGLSKTILGIRAPFVLTPWQLYRHLRRV